MPSSPYISREFTQEVDTRSRYIKGSMGTQAHQRFWTIGNWGNHWVIELKATAPYLQFPRPQLPLTSWPWGHQPGGPLPQSLGSPGPGCHRWPLSHFPLPSFIQVNVMCIQNFISEGIWAMCLPEEAQGRDEETQFLTDHTISSLNTFISHLHFFPTSNYFFLLLTILFYQLYKQTHTHIKPAKIKSLILKNSISFGR